MPNAAHIGSLRRKLRRSDASRAGSLAPCEFARALREFTGGKGFGDDDEHALCEAYDHRTAPAELIEDSGGMINAPMSCQDAASSSSSQPLRKQKTPREEDEGIRAWVETRAFAKRRGAESRQAGHGKSDEAMRSVLWNDDEKKTPPWDAVDYERFLDNLETRGAEDGPYYARRRTVRKLTEALSNDDARNKWDKEFVGATGKKFLTPSEAVAAFASLGIDLSRRELLHAVELGSSTKNDGLVDPRSLATRATREAEKMDAAEEERREAFFEQSRAAAEKRRRGGGNAVRGVRSTVLTVPKEDGRYFYLGTNKNKPMVFRTERPSKRVDRCFEDLELAAGKKSDAKTDAVVGASHQLEKKTPRSAGRTRHERSESLTLEKATASLTQRASKAKLGAAIDAMPSERISSPEELQRALSRVGAPLGSRDAARILAEAGGCAAPTRRQVADLIVGSDGAKSRKPTDASLCERQKDDDESRNSKRKGATRTSEKNAVADRVLSEAMKAIAAAPNPTYATTQQLCGWCREKPIVRRGRGTARRQDSHPWQFDDEDVDDKSLATMMYATACTRSIATPVKLPTRRKRQLLFCGKSSVSSYEHHRTTAGGSRERPRSAPPSAQRGRRSLRDYVLQERS